MKILLFVLSALLFSIVEPQIFRTIRFVPVPYQGPRIFRGSSPTFNIGRSRWSWGRCFEFPWIPACQRLFRRPRPDDWFQPNSRSQTPPPRINWQQQPPINRQPPRIFPQQPVPGNDQFPTGSGPIPDITHIQPVCNIPCARGLRLLAGECRDIGLDSLCTPSCPNGYICHHGHCDIAPCNPACSNGLTCRDGKCIDNHRCEPACCPGQVCNRGTCLAESSVPSGPVCNPPCPPGFVCHDGHCDKESSSHLHEAQCREPCPIGYVCHNGHCDIETSGPDTCAVPCVPPEVCNHGHCEIDRHTLTHLTNPSLDHTHDHSQPGAGGALIPVTRQTGHHDHEGPGGGDHDHHHQVRNQQGGGPGTQVTDFFVGGGRRTTPGAFGSQFQQNGGGGANDIHARIASEFRRSNIPDSQLGVDLSSILFQDPVTGQGVNISP